ncbi:MAG: peroxidase-related enzyme [Denitromonas halophila]|nr:MAG: peroxidase-related enzyme [Denitromonas halophila]
MSDRISRFPVPELTDLADDVRERILGVQEKAGFIPNVFLMLAHRPAEFRAFFDYHDALMEKNEGLTKAEREMIVVATSGAGNCLYCVVAHGAVLRIRAKNARVADQLATNYRKAEITERQRAMLDFAMKLSTNGGAVEDADMAALREHGFDDEAIWDIGAITAFFAMSNRLVHLTGTPPNEPFYLMGRLPKGS